MQLSGEIDCEATFTCGQIYHWWRNGAAFETTVDDVPISITPLEDGVRIEAEALDPDDVAAFLGLDHDLDATLEAIGGDGRIDAAIERHRGLRLLSIEFFPCLVGFIASQRSTVERTTAMIRGLCERYGASYPDAEAHGFPDAATVASLESAALEELGFGYRASYVVDTAAAVADGDVDPAHLGRCGYVEAKQRLMELPGVGHKVADCVLLFGLGHRDVVAVDTRIADVIERHYPDIDCQSYTTMADGFRERFTPHTGYAQTYLYHDASGL